CRQHFLHRLPHQGKQPAWPRVVEQRLVVHDEILVERESARNRNDRRRHGNGNPKNAGSDLVNGAANVAVYDRHDMAPCCWNADWTERHLRKHTERATHTQVSQRDSMRIGNRRDGSAWRPTAAAHIAFMAATPAIMAPAASQRAQPNHSFSATAAIAMPKSMDVSRSAATRAIGAWVIAQSASP